MDKYRRLYAPTFVSFLVILTYFVELLHLQAEGLFSDYSDYLFLNKNLADLFFLTSIST